MDEVKELLSESALADLLYEHDPMCGGEDCKRTAAKLAPVLNERLTKALTVSPEKLSGCAEAIRRGRFERTGRIGCYDPDLPLTENEIADARAAAIALGLKCPDM